jgi:hypothetical protein
MDIDFLLDVGFRGVPTGYRRVTALGNNPDIDTGTFPEDVWTGGGLYPWMSGSTSLEVVSDSANDTAAGTGARTVSVAGLNDGYDEVSQTITLNGLTAVAIPKTLRRINQITVITAGSGQTNAGAITVRDASAGATRGIIQAGYGVSRQSQYTVPAGYTMQVTSMVFSINRPSASLDATIAIFIQSSAGVYRLPLEISVDGNTYRHDGIPGIPVSEKTDFGFRCTYASGNNIDLTAGFLAILKKN